MSEGTHDEREEHGRPEGRASARPLGHTRQPAVAGHFYPAEPEALSRLVRECLEGLPADARVAKAALVPHAGLVYSGRCAGQVLGRLALPQTIVILAPNHTGRWASPGASIWNAGSFRTPLGAIAIDEAFASDLAAACDLVAHDPGAHLAEHAIEVELPFIQTRAPGARIVPIVLAWDDWTASAQLATALARIISRWPTGVLVLTSSDMTHYEPARAAERKDRLAFAAIERLDGRALLDVCDRERITMCGRAPAAVAVEAARQLGATRADLVDYRHSGLITGDASEVVSYAGIITD